MYHSFGIPRQGMSNTIDNIELNSFIVFMNFFLKYYFKQHNSTYFIYYNALHFVKNKIYISY